MARQNLALAPASSAESLASEFIKNPQLIADKLRADYLKRFGPNHPLTLAVQPKRKPAIRFNDMDKDKQDHIREMVRDLPGLPKCAGDCEVSPK